MTPFSSCPRLRPCRWHLSWVGFPGSRAWHLIYQGRAARETETGAGQQAWAGSRTAVGAVRPPPRHTPPPHTHTTTHTQDRGKRGTVAGSAAEAPAVTCQRRWAVLDPPPRSPCAAEAHLAVAHAPAHSLHAHLPALCARSRGEQHQVCPGRPGHRDLEGGAETHSRPLKGVRWKHTRDPRRRPAQPARRAPELGGRGPGASPRPPLQRQRALGSVPASRCL